MQNAAHYDLHRLYQCVPFIFHLFEERSKCTGIPTSKYTFSIMLYSSAALLSHKWQKKNPRLLIWKQYSKVIYSLYTTYSKLTQQLYILLKQQYKNQVEFSEREQVKFLLVIKAGTYHIITNEHNFCNKPHSNQAWPEICRLFNISGCCSQILWGFCTDLVKMVCLFV